MKNEPLHHLKWLMKMEHQYIHYIIESTCTHELRSEWVSDIVNKTANFLELDRINKFKVIFDIHHRITARFILRCYQLRKESLYRI